MITVNFGKISKRKNSTLQPTVSAAFSVALKENCSIENPTFQLTAGSFDYNYAKWGDRYYWIDNVISTRNNGWEVQCSLDYMATYKAAILATSAYVEYAAGGNNQIVDARISVEYGIGSLKSSAAQPSIIDGSGSYLVGIIGKETTDVFRLSRNAIASIMEQATTWSNAVLDYTDIVTMMGSALTQILAQGSAANCVKAAYWLPINVNGVVGATRQIYLGDYATTLTGEKIVFDRVSETVSVAIPHVYSDWRKQAPYTECYVRLPFYGVLKLPSDLYADASSLTCMLTVNVMSGDFTWSLRRGGGTTHEIQVGGNIYTPLLIGSSNISPSKIAGSVSAAVIGTAINPIAGFAGAAATLNALQPMPSATGAIGGSSNLIGSIDCFLYARNTSEAPTGSAATHGIPCFATRTLSALSGYVKTRGASVSASAEGAILDRINATLDSGAFLE